MKKKSAKTFIIILLFTLFFACQRNIENEKESENTKPFLEISKDEKLETLKDNETIDENLSKNVFLWKKFKTENFGATSLRFGDINNDGLLEILFVQNRKNPENANYRNITSITAVNINGSIIWQIGNADKEHGYVTSDLPLQIHDLNDDGKNEIIMIKDFELWILDANSTKLLKKVSTPIDNHEDLYGNLFGDSINFFDLEGKGYDSNIMIKDRYHKIWMYDENLSFLWDFEGNTGHFPASYDLDDDGKDEILIGYYALDDNGTLLWELKNMTDHSDGFVVEELDSNESNGPEILLVGEDSGFFIINKDGSIRKKHEIGHAQDIIVADFRKDINGLEIGVLEKEGSIFIYNNKGEYLNSFSKGFFRVFAAVNWGDEDLILLGGDPGNNVNKGIYKGLYNSKGEIIIKFPDDGHPEYMGWSIDLDEDGIDEVILHNLTDTYIYKFKGETRKRCKINEFINKYTFYGGKIYTRCENE